MENLQQQYPIDYQFTPNDINYLLGRLLLASEETDKKITRLSDLYGGISNNSKDVAEEFFFRGLENRKEFFGIEYEQIDTMSRHRGKLPALVDTLFKSFIIKDLVNYFLFIVKHL